MKIGIFGGTFNPIHNGHMQAAYEFLRQASLDRLYVIPDKIPPHKMVEADDDPLTRLAMTRLAFEEDRRFGTSVIVSDMEMTVSGKSYTLHTVKKFRELGMTDLFLYCGTDMLLTLNSWYHFEELLASCTIAFAGRERRTPELDDEIRRTKALLSKQYGARIFDIKMEPLEISSTEIRKKLRQGEDVSAFLPASVYAFIKENHLYQ